MLGHGQLGTVTFGRPHLQHNEDINFKLGEHKIGYRMNIIKIIRTGNDCSQPKILVPIPSRDMNFLVHFFGVFLKRSLKVN